jgi:hypothetical protein
LFSAVLTDRWKKLKEHVSLATNSTMSGYLYFVVFPAYADVPEGCVKVGKSTNPNRNARANDYRREYGDDIIFHRSVIIPDVDVYEREFINAMRAMCAMWKGESGRRSEWFICADTALVRDIMDGVARGALAEHEEDGGEHEEVCIGDEIVPDDVYEIEGIIDQYTNRKGVTYCLVKWVNYTEPTWEPMYNIRGSDETAAEYEARLYKIDMYERRKELHRRREQRRAARNFRLIAQPSEKIELVAGQ